MTDELEFPVPREPGVVLRVATVGAASGALAGGLEGLGVALGTKLLLGSAGVLALVGTAIVLDAALGLVAGLVAGAFATLVARRQTHWKRLRLGATLTVLALALYFFLPLARELWSVQERRGPALGMIALAAVVSATFWFNAGYWFRRESIGAGPKVGWRVYAPLVAVLLGGLAALLGGQPAGPTAVAPPGLPNLVLVTIDTLRRDHVGVYGSLANTPVLDRLAREGVVFDDAITPVPETAPSHASMLTGLHPVQHKVIANGIALRGGYRTVAEQLDDIGYRTGAFVSSFAVGSATGFPQGFQVYDDDFSPTVRGLGQVRLVKLLLPLLLRFGDPAAHPWLLERAAPDTEERALTWVSEGTGPVFLWVHLFEPHAPYEPRDGSVATVDHRAILAQEPGYPYTPDEEQALRVLYRGEVEYTDAQVGALLDGLRARGVLDNALVIVLGDHGESLGEHGIRFNHHGLYDEVVRVPLIAWASTPTWTPGLHVPRQVTVADVANSLLEFAGVPLLSGTESVPLLSLARGVVVPPRPVMLAGRVGISLKDGQLYGVRTPNGVKYIQRDDGDELYDDVADPGELLDIAADQPDAVRSGRANVETFKAALAGGPTADTSEMLKALGYVQ
jgi:arylsulfatase A-like enzyme